MTHRTTKRAVYLRWGPQRNRADDIAPALGARLIRFRWKTRSPLLVPVRYFVQFFQTLGWLFWHGPAIVFTQHTHPFTTAAGAVYACLTGATHVTDCHNGPFAQPVWRSWLFARLNRGLLGRTRLNMVHNHAILRHVTEDLRMPGRFVVMRTRIPDRPAAPAPDIVQPSVMMICSFAEDEPMDVMFGAAALVPEVHCYVTGNPAKLSEALRARIPSNVTLTGFMPNEEYDGLLQHVTAALALSTWPDILLKACHETIGAGTPFITTDAPEARRYLARGAVFVDNSADSVAAGIRDAIGRHQTLREEMVELRRIRLREWRAMAASIREEVGTGDDGGEGMGPS